ncbi:MAG: nucleotidyltransferase domain-containing protein [Fibromonadaceae bacterium]|jgi:predicted nucleotidyltransferase|nr:nucleotidyltransferase domain-containing protein [Fibromonadaceae bacterium]
MDSIDILKKAIRQSDLLNKYMLKQIGIFGSFARGEPANDIDFYIDTDNCKWADLKKLKKDLETLTNKRIDIMIKKYANPIVLHRALKDMVYVSA